MESRLFVFWNSGRKDRHRICFTWLQKELSTKFNSDCNTLQVVMMDLGPDWQWSLNPEVGNEVSNWPWKMGAWWNIRQIQTSCWLQELVWSNHRVIVTQDQRSGSVAKLYKFRHWGCSPFRNYNLLMCQNITFCSLQSYLALLKASIKGKELHWLFYPATTKQKPYS